jgi:prepilin-type N-terminal cleavage/methylation domain-containing protein
MKFLKQKRSSGFSLVELLVVISIITVLASVLYVNYNDSRAQARDKVRMTDLKSLQLAIETYKAQNGQYPNQGCGDANEHVFAGSGPASGTSFASCATYITGLTPDFISVLPKDPVSEDVTNKGFYYTSDGGEYKLMVYGSVEVFSIANWGDEFARCLKTGGACTGSAPSGDNVNTYAVFSAGAADW